MKFRLERSISNETVTMGKLIDDDFTLYTLENPWLDNQQEISCIPTGEYTCNRVDSPKYGNTFEVMWVPDRTHILFHYGNWTKNTKGCILLGIKSNWRDMIMSSRKAVDQFLVHTQDVDSFDLSVINIA